MPERAPLGVVGLRHHLPAPARRRLTLLLSSALVVLSLAACSDSAPADEGEGPTTPPTTASAPGADLTADATTAP